MKRIIVTISLQLSAGHFYLLREISNILHTQFQLFRK